MNTGIPNLDLKLKLGFRENANVLLIGPPGNEKLAFAIQFINQGLLERQNCVYITTDLAPSEIEQRASEFGFAIAPFTNNGLYFVDCYSWTLGKPSGREDIEVPGPSALNELSIGITQAVQQAYKPGLKSRAVLHSLSTLLLYNEPEIVYRFLQITGARLKAAEVTTLYLVEAGMHDEKVLTTLKHLCDSVFEITKEGEKLYLSSSTDGLARTEIKLGERGIEVL